MIRVPYYNFTESILPARKWKLNEEGKWRLVNNFGVVIESKNYPPSVDYPVELEIPTYTDQEYESTLTNSNWTKVDTDFLWDLCKRFQLKFIIIQDRFNEGKKGFDVKTVEEIKERYFDIVAKLQSIRGSTASRFIYDKELDSKRRMILESYHARPIEQSLEETFVVDYLMKLQQNGELAARLSERIETIKMLAGEQFTAGWPTLPELLKIAAGKGAGRFNEKAKSKKKKRRKPSEKNGETDGAADNKAGTNSASNSNSVKKQGQAQQKTSMTGSGSTSAGPPPSKKTKTVASTPGNIYLRSTKMRPLRVGSARVVEKILSDFGLPLKPDLPTASVVEKFDQVRNAIIRLIDARKSAGLPPSKSLDSSASSANL